MSNRRLLAFSGIMTAILSVAAVSLLSATTSSPIIITPSASIPNFDKMTEEQRTQAFMRLEVEDILKNGFRLTTERLKQAAQHFNAKEDDQARAVLDGVAITQEQDTLLQQQKQTPSAQVQAQLDDKATELLLLARLSEINYALGEQRIADASQYFEQALKSGRTAERLNQYALFLEKNQQFQPAEQVYTELLTQLRQQANSNPNDTNLGRVASTLNSLGTVIAQAGSTRWDEAQQLQTEALTISRKLAASNPDALSDLSVVLSSLSQLTYTDTTRSGSVAKFHTETLDALRPLADSNPDAYLPFIAGLLNTSGTMVGTGEAEQLYRESLTAYRKLAATQPDAYLQNVAMVLNNLGGHLPTDTTRRHEAEPLLTEALAIFRKLAATHPDPYLRGVFQQDVVTSLEGLGRSHLQWNEPAKARQYLQEAISIVEASAPAYPEQLPNLKATLASIK